MIILVITVKMEENLGKNFLNKCIVRCLINTKQYHPSVLRNIVLQ